jgi:hypothetical protein
VEGRLTVRPLFAPRPRRIVEATPEQVVATGAAAGSYGQDPIDNDTGYRRYGRGSREVPYWTREKAVTYSVASYRMNPMARAIIDTLIAFAVGDSGVTYQCTNPDVSKVVSEFWNDPRNMVGATQEIALRSTLLMGEKLYEMMVGARSGVVRYTPIDPVAISQVLLYKGNPMWPDRIELGNNAAAGLEGIDERTLRVVAVNDETELRDGEVMFWTPFKTLDTDIRSMPFLMPVLDDLDAYDAILSNLMDRTALARYMVWDVTVEGDVTDVDKYVAARGGLHVPPSGSVEVHNQSVTWDAKYAQVGADEDSVTSKLKLTSIAAGSGLSRTWLADPEDSNRATSLTMAEPVRRRVGAVQKVWLAYQTELVRFAVDRAVAARRLRQTVESVDPKTGERSQVPASQTVVVTGPEVAAADATIAAQVLLNLSTGLEKLVASKALSPDAAKLAGRKAWEAFMGIPYRAELDSPDADPDALAQHVDDNLDGQIAESRLALVR